MTRLARLSLSLALVAATLAGSAAPALACGMYEPRLEPAADRIANARDLLEENQLDEAAYYARSVAMDRTLDKKLRAEAYSIAGVIRWKQGNRKAAKQNFKKARALDPKQYETVVAQHADEKAIRAAVEDV